MFLATPHLRSRSPRAASYRAMAPVRPARSAQVLTRAALSDVLVLISEIIYNLPSNIVTCPSSLSGSSNHRPSRKHLKANRDSGPSISSATSRPVKASWLIKL